MSSLSFEWKGMNPRCRERSCAKSGADSSSTLCCVVANLTSQHYCLIPDCQTRYATLGNASVEEFGFLAAAMASSLVVKMRIPLIKFPSRIRICATTPPTASSPDSVKGAEVKASPITGIETGSSRPPHSGKGGGE